MYLFRPAVQHPRKIRLSKPITLLGYKLPKDKLMNAGSQTLTEIGEFSDANFPTY